MITPFTAGVFIGLGGQVDIGIADIPNVGSRVVARVTTPRAQDMIILGEPTKKTLEGIEYACRQLRIHTTD